jgi:potassium channel subfamily K
VFWKTESNEQQWTYFVSLYFSYTSLLTIGYGDLSPISNSGKPFFVFWSLLAIPSLTILISDMGDTVVKGIKDLTIWLGEITILPSDQGSVLERLEYGIYRATTRQLRENGQSKNNGDDDDSSSGDDHPYTLSHPPFFIKAFSKKKKNKDSVNDRITKDFEESERQGEHEAHDRGDKVAEGRCPQSHSEFLLIDC